MNHMKLPDPQVSPTLTENITPPYTATLVLLTAHNPLEIITTPTHSHSVRSLLTIDGKLGGASQRRRAVV